MDAKLTGSIDGKLLYRGKEPAGPAQQALAMYCALKHGDVPLEDEFSMRNSIGRVKKLLRDNRFKIGEACRMESTIVWHCKGRHGTVYNLTSQNEVAYVKDYVKMMWHAEVVYRGVWLKPYINQKGEWRCTLEFVAIQVDAQDRPILDLPASPREVCLLKHSILGY